LRDRLRHPDPRGGRVRSETATPPPPQLVGQPGHEWDLRPDDREVDVATLDQVDDRVDVVRGDRREAVGDLRDAGVPGGREHARDRGILRQAPAQRVLAPPAADDEDLHALTGMLCSRAGPTPTTETGTPPSSSRKRTYCCASFGR